MLEVESTVFVVDGDKSAQKYLGQLLDTVNLRSTEFESAQAFLDSYDQSQAGCLVLEVRMPDMSGPKLQDKLLERGINMPIIFLTGHGTVSMAVEAMKKGAVDFLQKPVDDHIFLERIRLALAKDAQLRQDKRSREAIAAKIALLTSREREVLQCVRAGKLSKAIAYDFGISRKTVDVHRSRIMEKLNVRSVAELITLLNKI
jgi:FixJ family two-component response regulator